MKRGDKVRLQKDSQVFEGVIDQVKGNFVLVDFNPGIETENGDVLTSKAFIIGGDWKITVVKTVIDRLKSIFGKK